MPHTGGVYYTGFFHNDAVSETHSLKRKRWFGMMVSEVPVLGLMVVFLLAEHHGCSGAEKTQAPHVI